MNKNIEKSNDIDKEYEQVKGHEHEQEQEQN